MLLPMPISSLRLLALIPAKGQSTRLPNKNHRSLGGKPLLAHTIELAQSCTWLDTCYVSTESADISALCQQYQMPVITRPDALAQHHTPSEAVMRHALEELDETYDALVLLQPTSPLRTLHHLEESIECYAQRDSLSLISVTQRTHQSYHGYTIEDGWLKTGDETTPFVANGAVYMVDIPTFMREGRIFLPPVAAYYMEKNVSLDIDTADDFARAEALLLQKQ
jgi:CMP-N,N'-diacetyllegionaminic acid synthase